MARLQALQTLSLSLLLQFPATTLGSLDILQLNHISAQLRIKTVAFLTVLWECPCATEPDSR